jgi:hypothetical protein
MDSNTICILTPKEEECMPWITSLASALQSVGKNVYYLDSSSLSWDPLGKEELPSTVINRVRDSTTGHQAKTVLAFLQFLEARGTKVFNGSHAFGIGNSKVTQLTILNSLGLHFPTTLVITNVHQLLTAAKKIGYPVLIKPEEGGMGRGIVKFSSESELQDYIDDPENGPKHEKSLWMLQEFIETRDNLAYRVWVCGGIVQCAIETFTLKREPTEVQCFNSCVCTLQKKSNVVIKATKLSPETEKEVLQIMDHCKAYVGSIEFFIAADGRRVYFDINMLSTLPDPSKVTNEGIWEAEYNPWVELATTMVSTN